jgi:hypothetical protein
LPGELDVLASKNTAQLPASDVDLGGHSSCWRNAHGGGEVNQSALESQEADPESLHVLADQYVSRHSVIANHLVYYSIEFWLLRRLGIDPLIR